MSRCQNCNKYASFNYEGERPLYCASHKIGDMINVKSKKCDDDQCNRRPTYNLPGEKRTKFCRKHADEGMIDIKSRRCEDDQCNKQPLYNLPGEKRAKFCRKHKEEGMIDIKSRRCEDDECNRRPNYNFPGEMKARFCRKHADEGMIDILNRRCEDDECNRRPNYNLPGEKRAKFCREHADEGMIDILNRRCEDDQCNKQPLYNLPGEKRAKFCRKHADEGMIDIKSRRCEDDECNRRPNYNFPGEKRAKYCRKHKEEGMIGGWIKKCIECEEIPVYGISGKRATHCERHRDEGMIVSKEEDECSICERNYVFIYSRDGERYCFEHYPDVKIKNNYKKICKYCSIVESDFVCDDCKQARHKKEWGVVRYLRKNIRKESKHDEVGDDWNCSRRRPDLLYECPMHHVIVEIDEEQHRGYDEICELARTNQIVSDKGGVPVTFIRYNPDAVRWRGRNMRFSKEERLNLLVRVLKREIDRVPDRYMVTEVKLFYDGEGREYERLVREDITEKVAI